MYNQKLIYLVHSHQKHKHVDDKLHMLLIFISLPQFNLIIKNMLFRFTDTICNYKV